VRLGRAYGLSGRHRDAVALLEAASQMEESLRFFASRPRALTYLGSAYLGLGDLDRARDLAERAAEFCATAGRRCDEAHALALLGEAHLRDTPPQRERAHAEPPRASC
jgi:tetratricopeptide (TPR) repeat protein